MTAARSAYEWWLDTGELAGFARATYHGTRIPMERIFEIVEKPWKWTEEHTAWVAAGRPEGFDPEAAQSSGDPAPEKP